LLDAFAPDLPFWDHFSGIWSLVLGISQPPSSPFLEEIVPRLSKCQTHAKLRQERHVYSKRALRSVFPLPPSDGERDGVRGFFGGWCSDCPPFF